MKGANVCPAFPVGVFLKQNVHVSFVFSRRNLSFMVLCCTMYPLYCGSIDQGFHLSLPKRRIRIARKYEKGYVLSLVFVYIMTCTCHLSCLLLNLVSVLSEILGKIKYKWIVFVSLVF